MAGLPWFELDTDYHDSPKVEALKSRLRNPEADAFPSRLYAYCYRHAVDRFDPEVASHTVESAAKWRGRRGALFDALFAVGVLERESGKVVVHGVADRLSPHLSKRAGDADRQRRRRDRAAESVLRHAPVTRDVTRESRSNRNKDKDPIVQVGEKDSCTGDDVTGTPNGAPRRDRLPLREELRAEAHPRTAALLAELLALGCHVGHAAELPTRSGIEAALETAPDGAASRVLTAWVQTKRPTIGWYLEAITGPPAAKTRAPDPRAPAAPSTDWSDKRAPWEIPS